MGALRFLLLVGIMACSYQPTRSGGAGADAIEDGTNLLDWWQVDYAYRAPITVATTTAAIDATYSVMFVADTGALVAAGKATSVGDDWRVVRRVAAGQWEELDRWIDDAHGSGWGGTDTRTWFALPVALGTDASDGETFVYYGSPTATNPSADLDRVFLFGDDFEHGLGKWTTNNLAEQVTIDGEHAGGTSSFKIITGGTAAAGVHRDITLPQTPLMWSHFLRQAQTNKSFSAARSLDCIHATRSPVTFVDSHLRLATELDSGDKMQIWTNPLDNWSALVPANEWHEVDTVFDGSTNQVTARFDGGAWHAPSAPYSYLQGTPSLSIALEGEGGQNGTFWVDNYVIRRFADPEPTTSLGPEEPQP